VSINELAGHRPKVTAGSDRSFGIVFAAVFAIISIWPWLFGGSPRIWSAAVAVVIAIIAMVWPRLLSPFNQIWFRFGLVIHHIVNPIVMAVIYFVAVVPTGLALKLAGKDPLRLKREPDSASYWIVREPPGPPAGSMSNQF